MARLSANGNTAAKKNHDVSFAEAEGFMKGGWVKRFHISFPAELAE